MLISFLACFRSLPSLAPLISRLSSVSLPTVPPKILAISFDDFLVIPEAPGSLHPGKGTTFVFSLPGQSARSPNPGPGGLGCLSILSPQGVAPARGVQSPCTTTEATEVRPDALYSPVGERLPTGPAEVKPSQVGSLDVPVIGAKDPRLALTLSRTLQTSSSHNGVEGKAGRFRGTGEPGRSVAGWQRFHRR